MSGYSDGAGDNSPGAIKVIGSGQSLRGDDGAGLAAVRLWVEIYPAEAHDPAVQVELAELPGIGLLNILEGASYAVLVDAVHSGSPPGTIHRLTEDQLESFASGSGSAHGWGVAETLSLGRQLAPGSLPAQLLVIGIEVGALSLGEDLSPQVKEALADAARLIEAYVSAALRP